MTPDSRPIHSFLDQMENVRALHRTLDERVSQPDRLALGQLAEKLASPPDDRRVRELALGLESREMASLFPLLVQPGTDDRLAGRINLVIHERACRSLYLSGWISFQHVFPHPAAARALAMLCRTLEKQERACRAQPAGRGPASPALISALAQPDHRQFLNHLADRLLRLDITLGQAVRDYQVNMDSAFGLGLGTRYFLSGPPKVFTDDAAIFAQILPQLPLPRQAELAGHILGLAALEPSVRNTTGQLLYRVFGNPAASGLERHPVWNLVKPREKEAFRNWVIAATIGTHCRDHQPKARLYLDFAESILKLEHWDDETLLFFFPGFIVADTRRQPGLAIYYNQPRPDVLPFSQEKHYFQLNPANPSIPHRQVDDAVRMMNFQGIIGLPFDEEGIRLSRVFLSLRLKEAVVS